MFPLDLRNVQQVDVAPVSKSGELTFKRFKDIFPSYCNSGNSFIGAAKNSIQQSMIRFVKAQNVLRADVNTAPDAFICPISLEIMDDPVFFNKQTYDRSSIEDWINRCKETGKPLTDPLTNEVVESDVIVRNYALLDLITAWKMFQEKRTASQGSVKEDDVKEKEGSPDQKSDHSGLTFNEYWEEFEALISCPISYEEIVIPATLGPGTYEREAIEDWVANNHSCPKTRAPAEVKDLIPNIAFKNAIAELKAKKELEIKLQEDVKKHKENKEQSVYAILRKAHREKMLAEAVAKKELNQPEKVKEDASSNDQKFSEKEKEKEKEKETENLANDHDVVGQGPISGDYSLDQFVKELRCLIAHPVWGNELQESEKNSPWDVGPEMTKLRNIALETQNGSEYLSRLLAETSKPVEKPNIFTVDLLKTPLKGLHVLSKASQLKGLDAIFKQQQPSQSSKTTRDFMELIQDLCKLIKEDRSNLQYAFYALFDFIIEKPMFSDQDREGYQKHIFTNYPEYMDYCLGRGNSY
jgi:hypothetical protein